MFLILIPTLIVLLIVARLVRFITRPYRPYGSRYNPYGYTRGYRRHRFGPGLVTILGLVALDRLFHNRRP